MSKKREFATGEGMDFLNSFIARDLDRFSEAVRLGRYGTALDAYMRTSEPGRTSEQGLLEVLRAWEITAGEGCADAQDFASGSADCRVLNIAPGGKGNVTTAGIPEAVPPDGT